MSSWQLFPAQKAFDKRSKAWDDLNQVLYQQHPLLESRFVQTLIQFYGDQNLFLVVYGNEKDSCSAALLLQKISPGIWRTFLPSQAQIAPALSSDANALTSLFDTLPGYPISIELLCQDPDYSFKPEPLIAFDDMVHAVTINISLKGSFDDYWTHRSNNLRNNIKRYFNRLDKSEQGFNTKVHTEKKDLNEALLRYGVLETKSWKGDQGTAIHQNNRQGEFYSALLGRFCESGQAEIIELYFGETMVASRINLINDEMLVILKTCFDSSFSKFAPGRLLLYLLIEREFDLQRVKNIEFYTNATKDQISWSTGQRKISHFTLYRSELMRQLYKRIKALIKIFR